jgi:hypothetical protein
VVHASQASCLTGTRYFRAVGCREATSHTRQLLLNRRERTVPVIGSTLCCVVTVVITQKSPHVPWVQAYGPNIAAMFLGVAFTVGAVQLFLDREQKRLRGPRNEERHRCSA